MLGRDGDRATVIARYRDDHLPSPPDLLARQGELRRHERLIHAPWPYGDDSISVGDVLRRTAAGPGAEADGRGLGWW